MFIKPRKVREGEIFLHFRWGSSGMMRMKRRREKETLRRNPIKMRKWNFRTRKYDGRLILSQCFSSALGKMLGNCDDLWSHERGNCGRMLSVEVDWGRKGMCSTFECHSLPLFFMCEKLLQASHSMLLRNRHTSTFLPKYSGLNQRLCHLSHLQNGISSCCWYCCCCRTHCNTDEKSSEKLNYFHFFPFHSFFSLSSGEKSIFMSKLSTCNFFICFSSFRERFITSRQRPLKNDENGGNIKVLAVAFIFLVMKKIAISSESEVCLEFAALSFYCDDIHLLPSGHQQPSSAFSISAVFSAFFVLIQFQRWSYKISKTSQKMKMIMMMELNMRLKKIA